MTVSSPHFDSNSPICEQVGQKVTALMDASGAPGFAIGLVRGGAVVCAQAYGLESLHTLTPMTPDSNFHMASVSKAFAAVAIVQLVLEGKINLDAPMVQYIPEFYLTDARYRQITARHILKHQSGMPDVEDYEWDKPKTNADAARHYLKSLVNTELLSEPGSQFAYSNMAFELLAVLIAQLTNLSFEDYTEQHLFKPAGMLHSSYLYPAPQRVSQAMPHGVSAGGEVFERVVYPYNRQHAPSSTLESNVRDMNRWMISAMDSRSKVLPRRGWEMLWTPSPGMLSAERPHYRMGLGWFVRPHGGETIVLHAGSDEGFTTMMMMNPQRQTGVTMMTNTDSPRRGIEAAFDFETLGLELLDALVP